MQGVIDYAPSLLAADFRSNTVVVNVPTGVTFLFAPASPNRVMLHVWGRSNNPIRVGPASVLNALCGDVIPTLGQSLEYKFSDYGNFVTGEFYIAHVLAGAVDCCYTEVIYEPRQ